MTVRNPVEFVDENLRRAYNRVIVNNGITSSIPVQFGDSPSVDAFARVRFVEPFTLFDSKQIWDDPGLANNVENYPIFFDNQEISGGGTSTLFQVNRASTTLGVSANTVGERVRQTKQRFNYQPGKSMLAIFTDVNLNAASGVTKEIGLFDDNNGLFFRNVGGTQSVVVRSFATGAAVNTVYTQNQWNKDKLNGNGPSGINLDFVKSQIPFVDFEWLGVGRVRYGWFIDGIPIYCHTVNNANNLNVVYMSTPNLPIRSRIANDGTGAADTLEVVCSTIISEGGVQARGTHRANDIGALAASRIQANVINTSYAVCGIRLKSAYLSAQVDLVKISMLEDSGANNPFIWRLHFNPTLTSGLSWTDQAQSAIQFGTGLAAGDVLTDDGYIIDGGYVERESSVNPDVQAALRLGSLIDGTPDEIVLSITPITANQRIFGGIKWQETW